jgi:hypothetical protein
MLHIVIVIAIFGIIGLVAYFLSAGMLLGLVKFFEFCKKQKFVISILIVIFFGYLMGANYLTKPDTKSLLDTAISVNGNSPPLSYLSKSYSFKGVYKSGYFNNCCSNGESKRTQYGYLQLPYQLKINIDNRAGSTVLYEFDQIQIGLDKESFIADGTLIKLQCKELWEGNNGHYALWVYCSEPVLSVY